jgi:hypothetical protein
VAASLQAQCDGGLRVPITSHESLSQALGLLVGLAAAVVGSQKANDDLDTAAGEEFGAQALEAGEVPLVEGDFARPVELDDVAGGDLVEESLTPSDEGLPALARG